LGSDIGAQPEVKRTFKTSCHVREPTFHKVPLPESS
jgi:hypothetical protein